LQKISTIARAIERYLALFTAALRADFPVYCRTESLSFSFITDSATQTRVLKVDYFTEKAIKDFHYTGCRSDTGAAPIAAPAPFLMQI
jgi:hypothetical protein